MALVRKLEKLSMLRNNVHDEVECTYSIFQDNTGQRYLQVDTYGSSRRQFRGKKSQSIQFGPEAIEELRRLLRAEISPSF
jgi:hypothetical protein